MYSWEYATHEDYKPIPQELEPEKWLECEQCGEKPRLWIFDNGNFAKCRCLHRFERAPAQSESIMSVVARTGGFTDYSREKLRDAWNRYIETGHQQCLTGGRW